ncbi:hypothetical protein TNCV_3229011 [Trichonephila clavipes]|nr:hypothetical protein TNCV_3229011 [Trichonephila clavipes]
MIKEANLLAITLKDNFTENERPNGDYPIDNTITTTLENFFSLAPTPSHYPTDPDEVLNYIKLFLTIKPQRGESLELSFLTFRRLLTESGNLECVSILLSSIWDSDFHGFGNLGLKRGRDFRGGDPMAVQEALAMERSLIGGWQ